MRSLIEKTLKKRSGGKPGLSRAFGIRMRGILGSCMIFTSLSYAAYPERPVQVVVPYAAGGPTDLTARLIAQALGERIGQQVLVINKGGAGGNLGAEYVGRAKPDGHTLLVIGAAHAINASLYSQLGYDLKKDFVPIALWTSAPLVLLANRDAPFNSVQELVALAVSKPDQLSYASSGNGTAPHLVMEILKTETGARLVHVPYRGSAPALTDMVSGEVAVAFDSLVLGKQYAEAGKLKALAVTGRQRSPVMPDVPTMAEAGYPQIDAAVWYGLAAPAGTPSDVIESLNQEIREVLRDPRVVERLATLGVDVEDTTPAQFKAFLASEIDKWSQAVKASGARVD